MARSKFREGDHSTRSAPVIREVRRITWIGFFINLFLAGLKFALGTLGHSQAVVADAVHSLSDLTTDIAVLFGVKYWSAPADPDHPYGHRRIETLITAGIGLALVAVAAWIGYSALSSLRHEEAGQPEWVAFAAAVISILVKEGLYRWTQRIGLRIRSSALLANAWHHRSDALSSIPAAAVVAVARINPEWGFVDHVGAVIVALFILYASWTIMLPAFNELSDRGEPEHVRQRIREVSRATDGVDSVHKIRTRRMGSGMLVDLHITVDGNLTVSCGHDISEMVKHRIMEQVPDAVDVIVHLEPASPERRRQS